jgi:cytochrome P450
MLPLLGGLFDYQRDPLSFLQKTAAAGEVVRIKMLGLDSYLLSHPRDIEAVLKGNHRDYLKDRFTRVARPLLGDGLLVSEGELWRKQRRLIAPSFAPQQIARYADIMAARAALLVERLRAQTFQKTRLDLHAPLMRSTLEIVAECLFGAVVDEHVHTVEEALDQLMLHYASPVSLLDDWLLRLPLPRSQRFRRSVRALDEVVFGIIKERRQHPRDSWDLLSALLAAQGEDGSRMSDAQLRDEVLTLFLAGHETTALTLSYAAFCLAARPEAQRAIAEEVAREGCSPGAVPKLHHTKAAIKEALRLYPPAWILGRESRTPVQVAGYDIPQGVQLVMAPWVTHRDPRFFSNPEQFWPERWLDKAFTDELPRGAYYPFGDGPRVCVGNFFAMQESVLLLAALVSRFELHPATGKKLEFLPSITLRPKNGVWVELSPRAAAVPVS